MSVVRLVAALGRAQEELSLAGVLTLCLVPFDHAWTLGQDGFLERRHQSVNAALHQL